MRKLKIALASRIKGGKIAVLGIGSELRGDDAAGMLAAAQLKNWNTNRSVKVFLGATAPENLTSEIKKFGPKHLIIIDSADIGKEAGAVDIIDPEKIGGISFSTHSLPLKMIVEYLRAHVSGEIIIIGIQQKSLTFGSPPSEEVERSVKGVCDTIKELIEKDIYERTNSSI